MADLLQQHETFVLLQLQLRFPFVASNFSYCSCKLNAQQPLPDCEGLDPWKFFSSVHQMSEKLPLRAMHSDNELRQTVTTVGSQRIVTLSVDRYLDIHILKKKVLTSSDIDIEDPEVENIICPVLQCKHHGYTMCRVLLAYRNDEVTKCFFLGPKGTPVPLQIKTPPSYIKSDPNQTLKVINNGVTISIAIEFSDSIENAWAIVIQERERERENWDLLRTHIYSREPENSPNFLYLPNRYSFKKTDFGTLQNETKLKMCTFVIFLFCTYAKFLKKNRFFGKKNLRPGLYLSDFESPPPPPPPAEVGFSKKLGVWEFSVTTNIVMYIIKYNHSYAKKIPSQLKLRTALGEDSHKFLSISFFKARFSNQRRSFIPVFPDLRESSDPHHLPDHAILFSRDVCRQILENTFHFLPVRERETPPSKDLLPCHHGYRTATKNMGRRFFDSWAEDTVRGPN
ncbi:hypothetical protein LXL04_000369 [Taraxacum kok-saghyz]